MSLLEKEWFIQAPWGRICIIAWGECFSPPVLLCHGIMDCAASFRPLVQLLPNNFYYIGVELPGNGKSDRLPPGLMINSFDLVYAIKVVVDHFRWNSFVYVGHSLGALLGKLYNLSHPGKISKVIDLDPTPVYNAVTPKRFPYWHKRYFTDYYNNYDKFNSPKETAPKYTIEEAITTLKNNRGLTDETAAIILERMSEPAGDGFIRYTFDQRFKIITQPPFSPAYMQQLYTNIKTPTLTIISEQTLKVGFYSKAPFALDPKAYPALNYRVFKVEGNHDLHLTCPDKIAFFVSQFLLYGLEGLDSKSKL